jgi:hypothetical protein
MQIMAGDTSFAVARCWAMRTGCALLLGALLAAPAPAAEEQVYVWRDRDGAVRFSEVERPAARVDGKGDRAQVRGARERPAPAQVVGTR